MASESTSENVCVVVVVCVCVCVWGGVGAGYLCFVSHFLTPSCILKP